MTEANELATLEEQAREARSKLAAANKRQEEIRREQVAASRERERAFNRSWVADWRARDIEGEIAEAGRSLDQAIRKLFADYIALRRLESWRYNAYQEAKMLTTNVGSPPPTGGYWLLDRIQQVVENAGGRERHLGRSRRGHGEGSRGAGTGHRRAGSQRRGGLSMAISVGRVYIRPLSPAEARRLGRRRSLAGP